jgi:hypothetical protein
MRASKTISPMYLPKPSLFMDSVYWSPIRQQYCVAFNQTGDIKDLHVWSWHNTKREALVEAKRKTEFRLGFTADCTDLYKHLDAIEKALS